MKAPALTEKKIRLLINFLTILFSLFFYSQTSQAETYVGTIKNIPIVMELNIYDGQISGRYFYKKYGVDIPLSGYYDKAKIHLIENEEKRQGIFLFLNKECGFFCPGGYWYDELNSKSLPINLREIDGNSINPNDSYGLDRNSEYTIYDILRQESITFSEKKSAPFTDFSSMELIWMQDKKSKLEFFNLKANQTFTQVQKVNKFLEEEFRRFNLAFYEGASTDILFNPNFARENLLSFSVLGNIFYPGTAHPAYLDNHYTIHIPSARLLSIEDIITLPENQQVAPWLMSQLLQIAPNEMQSQPECNYMDINTWNIDSHSGWYLTNKGLHISPTYPFVLNACGSPEWAVLPLSVIQQNPGLVTIE
ncbi:hypothetical protein [Thorsellia kenyensis]|uniref:DUF3298 domain-containing protein n=1 Tax=Thorsellia kenyensis TaxID=1549888 RepID=A0ABV6CD79_9GAMM